MDPQYLFVSDLLKEAPIPENGILSRTLQNDERSKIIVFGFAEGQELSAHTAPMPAVIHVVKGKASVRLGDDVHAAEAGSLIYMPPLLEHGIRAETPLVMLLVLIKTG